MENSSGGISSSNWNDNFGEDFGQKVDLTQRIREVLANYPEGTTILKELIQNADDAGATNVSFCLDRRNHSTEALVSPQLAPFQGPSLLVHNNATFTEQDFESISKVGDSKKRGQSWKTGRFGIGFNSVYHLSDLPSFVSGRYLVIFDPHCSYLPRVSASNPGKRIDFVSGKNLITFPNQFTPYCVFGCDMKQVYDSTLFRFPLRTVDQAQISKLSRQSYSADDMWKLLQEFQEEAVSSLLFLKHVEKIQVLEWMQNESNPTVKFCCSIDQPNSDLRFHRQIFTRLATSPPDSSDRRMDIYSISFSSQWEGCNGDEVSKSGYCSYQSRTKFETYLIAQSMANISSRIGSMAKNAAKEYDIHLTPWASVAALMSPSPSPSSSSTNADASSPSDSSPPTPFLGKAFCFLPLPVQTGLPVHINGYFELSSNRRDIWYGHDMDRAGKLRSDWNTFLLTDVAAPAYAQLILNATSRIGPNLSYYSLFPSGTLLEPWTQMVIQLYTILSSSLCLHSDGRWISPINAIYHDEEHPEADYLEKALLLEKLPLVRLPEGIRELIFKHGVKKPKMILPSVIRPFLRNRVFKGLHSDKLAALHLLEYSLGDVLDEEAGEELYSINLVPMADDSWSTFGFRQEDKELIVAKEGMEYELFKSCIPNQVIQIEGVKPSLLERFQSIASLSKSSNLWLMDSRLLSKLLPLILPPNWKNKDEISWDDSEISQSFPNFTWMQLFWKYISSKGWDLSLFFEWPLIPVKDSKLCRLNPKKSALISSENWESNIPLSLLLCKLGGRMVRNDVNLTHPQLKDFIHQSTGMGALDLISVLKEASNDKSIQNLFSSVSVSERIVLRNFLYREEWYVGGQMNESRLKIFRELPIFESYGHIKNIANSSTSQATDAVSSDDHPQSTESFVSVSGSISRFVAPIGVDEGLLGSEFIKYVDDRELSVLTGPLGVKRLPRAQFFKLQVIAKLPTLEPDLRNRSMIALLLELPQISAKDSTMREVLVNLKFVPSLENVMYRPDELYDPRVTELKNLLEGSGLFPNEPFSKPDLLDILHGLGLRTTVTPDTVILSAKTIEACHTSDPEKACQRGKILLSFLELHCSKWLLPQTDGFPFSNSGDAANVAFGKMVSKFQSLFQGQESGNEQASKHSAVLEQFWQSILSICWCPVLVHSPIPNLPWPSNTSSVVPPRLVRLPSDLWLVSASMRILSGECRSSALCEKLGWLKKPSCTVLSAQLLELGKLNIDIEDRALGQALASSVPQIYTLLSDLLRTEEIEIVKAVLDGSKWVWVGDRFCSSSECVFNGPLNLSPYLRVIPSDMLAFKDLFLYLGVRETLTPTEFAQILNQMAEDSEGKSLNSLQLTTAIWLVQHLADLHFVGEGKGIFVPDSSAILLPAGELVYNDAPWLPSSAPLTAAAAGPSPVGGRVSSGPRFVHAKISNDVADKLGVRSLRRRLLAESADSMALGLHEAAEAFGQHEALTTRLKHIVEMYADGPGILCELVQNADDAGASEVAFLLDCSNYGTSSLLSPRMAEWQGPALCCYNNSVFSQRDLYAISRIGQDAKLEKPTAIGRFGLGFNSVYHFTDVPCFVSGQTLVIFDPHACNLPGITPSHPGLKIKFDGSGLLEQFPDQFSPFLHFGCNLQNTFPATLFRFPLRTQSMATCSEIKQEAYTPVDVYNLFDSFRPSAEEALLFLRNVSKISIYVKEEGQSDTKLLYSIDRRVQSRVVSIQQQQINARSNGDWDYRNRQREVSQQNSVYEFVRGDVKNPLDKEQFYRKLQKTPVNSLPWHCNRISITTKSESDKVTDWLICSALGGGKAREQAIAAENRARGFIPWAGIAAKVENIDNNSYSNVSNGVESHTTVISDLGKENSEGGELEGKAFCFLPLPVKTELPVHVNGYFELSSNRRDIWHGDDMAGGGKLRAVWNYCLLEDAAAPAYARLLAEAAVQLGHSSAYYQKWPVNVTTKPWNLLGDQVYSAVNELELPVLYSPLGKGKWFSPKASVLPDFTFPDHVILENALVEVGLPVVSLPSSIVEMFKRVCPNLQFLTPALLRSYFSNSVKNISNREVVVLILKYCLSDIEEFGEEAARKLDGLSILPLANGRFGRFSPAEMGDLIVVGKEEEFQLLGESVPHMLIDKDIDSDVLEQLQLIAKKGKTNLKVLDVKLFEEILPKLVPPYWHKKDKVNWITQATGEVNPSVEWVQCTWKFLGNYSGDLSRVFEWPLAPTTDGFLLKLKPKLPIIRDGGWNENMTNLLQKCGIYTWRTDIPIPSIVLDSFIRDATAEGMLDALLFAVRVDATRRMEEYLNGIRASVPIRGNYTAESRNERTEQMMSYISKNIDNFSLIFDTVSDGEKRELRSYLCQSKWFAGEGISGVRLQIFRMLPIFESFESSPSGGRLLVDIPHNKRWFAPIGVDESLLDSSFVRGDTDREEEVLKTKLYVQTLDKNSFYKVYFFPKLANFSIDVVQKAMLKILSELEELCEGDEGMKQVLIHLPFVPTINGGFKPPKRLYDPRSIEIFDLLGEDFFPSGAFATTEMLNALSSLGLKTSLNFQGILDSANSIETMKNAGNIVSAKARGKLLLSHLDSVLFSKEEENDSSRLVIQTPSENTNDTNSSSMPSDANASITVNTFGLDESMSESVFWENLSNIAWCPVLEDPPEPKIPWQNVRHGGVSSPRNLRPKADAWLVSASMHILDFEIRSHSLLEKIGWNSVPSCSILAIQLLELSHVYAQTVLKQNQNSIELRSGGLSREELDTDAYTSENELEKLTGILSEEIPKMYDCLDKQLSSDTFGSARGMLQDSDWVWVGDRFVSSRQLAFDSPAHFHPYLHVVPTEISVYKRLLLALGVKEHFEANDYIYTLRRMSNDSRGTPLTPEQLSFSFRVIEALYELINTQTTSLSSSSSSIHIDILIPDSHGILTPAKELVFNDATWLAGSIGGSSSLHRLVHPELSNEVAERLGAKSLRYLSLVDKEMTDSLSCKPSHAISDILSYNADRDFLLFDFLEIADAIGAKRMEVIFDKRQHQRQSLLQPNLGKFQGPSITLSFNGACLSKDEVCSLMDFPPYKLRGNSCLYGSGFLSAYHLTDLPLIASNSCLFLFDPSGRVLASSLTGARSPTRNMPLGKAYSLNGTDLLMRFADQFKPLSVGSSKAYGWIDGTIIRMPLRSTNQNSKKNLQKKSSPNEYWGPDIDEKDVLQLLQAFKSHLDSTLLFLSSVESVSLSTWEEGENEPTEFFSVRVDPQKAHFRNPFQDKKWKKFNISNFFGGNRDNLRVNSIDIVAREGKNDQQVVDRWLVVHSLGAGHTRDMSFDRKYLTYNLTPSGGVAARLLHNSSTISPQQSSNHCINIPFPLLSNSNLPVTIFGHFIPLRGSGRHLFRTFPEPAGPPHDSSFNLSSVSNSRAGQSISMVGNSLLSAFGEDSSTFKSQHVNDSIEEALASAWNKELLSCVNIAYVELLQELNKLRSSEDSSKPDFSLGRGMDGVSTLSSDAFYDYWPRASKSDLPKESSSTWETVSINPTNSEPKSASDSSSQTKEQSANSKTSMKNDTEPEKVTVSQSSSSLGPKEKDDSDKTVKKKASLNDKIKNVKSTVVNPSVDSRALVEWLIRPLYLKLSDIPLWLLHGGGMAKTSEGMFLAPPGTSQQSLTPPKAVGDFLKSHYKVFSVPWDLTAELTAAGVTVKELTPKMLRLLLRTEVAAAVKSIHTQVDLLEYCCADIRMEMPAGIGFGSAGSDDRNLTTTSTSTSIPNPNLSRVSTAEAASTPNQNSTTRTGSDQTYLNRNNSSQTDRLLQRNEMEELDGSTRTNTETNQRGTYIETRHLTGFDRMREILRERQDLDSRLRVEIGSMDEPSSADSLGRVANLGRVLVDSVRNAVEDFQRIDNRSERRNAQNAVTEPAPPEIDPFLVDQQVVSELKGVFIPVSSGKFVKISSIQLLIATPEQQSLLPSFSNQFIHTVCLSRPLLNSIFRHRIVRETLNLKLFSAQILASGIHTALPLAWAPRTSPNQHRMPWVVWKLVRDPNLMPCPPKPDWVRNVWSNVNCKNEQELALFSHWPLIPAEVDGGVLVRVEQRQLVFVPPEPKSEPPCEAWNEEIRKEIKREKGISLHRISIQDSKPSVHASTSRSTLPLKSSYVDRIKELVSADELLTSMLKDDSILSTHSHPSNVLTTSAAVSLMEKKLKKPMIEEAYDGAKSGEGSPMSTGESSHSRWGVEIEGRRNERMKRWRYDALKMEEPWLFSLIQKLSIPIFDYRFVDSKVFDCVNSPAGMPLQKILVSKLIARQNAEIEPNISSIKFTPQECESLFSFFSSHMRTLQNTLPLPPPASTPPNSENYTLEEIGLLRNLQIYHTLTDKYVSINPGMHCMIPPDMFFTPEDDRCLVWKPEVEVRSFYNLLGATQLEDTDVMARFALTSFSQLTEEEKERILSYLLSNWLRLKQNAALVNALKDTEFIVPGKSTNSFPTSTPSPILSTSSPSPSPSPSPSSSSVTNSNVPRRVKANTLLDPANSTLSRVFATEPNRFPGSEFCSVRWLSLLRDVGMKSAMDAELVLECAKKVESLASEEDAAAMPALSESERHDQTRSFGMETRNRSRFVGIPVNSELWTTAGLVVETMMLHFASLYSGALLDQLRTVKFIPAESGIPGSGDRVQVLTCYSEAVFIQDWPLAWTVSPVLVQSNTIPAQFSWGQLRLRSPPPLSTVVSHLQRVGLGGGEEALARWPNAHGITSVDDAFASILKYLASNIENCSVTEVNALKEVNLVPVGNGTRLVKACDLYARLGINLMPFAYELPTTYLPYSQVLKTLGMQDSPTAIGMRSLLTQLQKSCGYQRLNPNELNAVLRMIDFICNDAKETKVPGSEGQDTNRNHLEGIVPDEGSRLVSARMAVHVDPAGMRLLGEIDTTRVRFVHPRVPEAACEVLGVRRLSTAVVEELDESQPIIEVNSLGPHHSLNNVIERLQSDEFIHAVYLIVKEHSESISSLKNITFQNLRFLLSRVSHSLCFVSNLETRFVLLPKRTDVTLKKPPSVSPSPSSTSSSASMGDSLSPHRVYEFVDGNSKKIYLAKPPNFVPPSSLLASVISKVINSPFCLPLTPLFDSPQGSLLALCKSLRLGLPEGMVSQGIERGKDEERAVRLGSVQAKGAWDRRREAEGAGLPGTLLLPADAVLVQYHPLRPFHAGEIVAWKGDEREKGDEQASRALRYGKVVRDIRPMSGQALYRVQVETFPDRVHTFLSSSIFSFKSSSSTLHSQGEDLSSSTEQSTSLLEPSHLDLSTSSPSAPNSRQEDATVGSLVENPSHEPTASLVEAPVSAADVVSAVHDMLSAVGMPLGLEQNTLLTNSLVLQEKLDSVEKKLVEEKTRGDTALRESEAAKSAWVCRICLFSDVNSVLIPCGHVLCEGCSGALDRCPFCRSRVQRYQKIFRP